MREAHPGQDRRVVEQDDVVEVPLRHRQRPGAGERRAEPVGDALGLDLDDLVALDGEADRVRSARFDAVHADPGPLLLERRGDARDQAAAADADDDDVEVGLVLEQLEANRTMAGDDGRVIERVDEAQALRVADPLHLGEGLADVGAMEDDPRAVAEAGIDLGAHGAGGHDDRDRDPRRATRPGVRLPGVARRQGDDAARALGVVERGDPVGHARAA